MLVGEMDMREDLHRMVAVFDVDTRRRCFFGALVTNELSLATADDIIVGPDQTGLPYSVAVINQLVGYLWFAQVTERLGALTEEAIDACLAGSVGAEDEFQYCHRGIPLQDRVFDLRWPILESELATWRTLTLDCATKRHGAKIELPYIDPRLLPVYGNFHNGFHAETLSVLEEATRAGRTRGFSPSCAEEVAKTLDSRMLRAYPRMFQPNGSITTSPPTRKDQDDPGDWLFELTMADARAGSGFVKMIGGDDRSEPTRFDSNGRRYEFLYETVKETSV